MTRSIQAEEKLGGFINKLASLGYEVAQVSKKPQVYRINGELVNIRSRGKSRETAHGRQFWYSVAFSVLHEVKWVIYITTDPDYFFKFPSGFLENLKGSMYPDKSKAGVGIFDIDWDNEKIVLKNEETDISEYYCNLKNKEVHPKF